MKKAPPSIVSKTMEITDMVLLFVLFNYFVELESEIEMEHQRQSLLQEKELAVLVLSAHSPMTWS